MKDLFCFSLHCSSRCVPLCMAGASRSLGLPNVASKCWETDQRLHVFRDCLCLRLLSLHLYPYLGKFEIMFKNTRSGFITLDPISHTWSLFSDIMGHSLLLAPVAVDCHCHGDLWLRVGHDILAGCSRRHKTNGFRYNGSYSVTSCPSGCWLQGERNSSN